MTSLDRPVDVSILTPASPGPWTAGMANLLRKELRQWFGTRTWWVQLTLWVVILNGVTTAVMFDPELPPPELLEEAVLTFLQMAATVVAIGVVLATQGAIVGERELGTAAWVLSKPASRPSFVLAKLVAHATGFVLLAITVPAVLFAVEVAARVEAPLDTAQFALGVAVVSLSVIFYLTLTLALGTLFRGRGPVAGLGIGLVLMGLFFKGMLPVPLVVVTPWLLGDVAGSITLGTTMEIDRMVPVVATTVATVGLLGMALWRFQREEF